MACCGSTGDLATSETPLWGKKCHVATPPAVSSTAAVTPIASPSFALDWRRDSGLSPVGTREAVAAEKTDGSSDPDSVGFRAEVQPFGSSSCAGRALSGSFVEARTGIAVGKSKALDCAPWIPSFPLGSGLTCAAVAFESTGWPHFLQRCLPGKRGEPQCAQEGVVGEMACGGNAAGAGSATGADLPTGLPHCLQKRLPGARSAPQCKQDRGAGSGAATGSGISGATFADTGCPHPPQKRLPSATSLPHFVQHLFATSVCRGSALVAESAARFEKLAALYALALRWDGRFLNQFPIAQGMKKGIKNSENLHHSPFAFLSFSPAGKENILS